MTQPRALPSATDLFVALGTAVVTLVALLATPSLLEADDTTTITGVAWWTTAALLTVAALLLCFARVMPRIVLLATASIAMLLGVTNPTGFASLAGAAVLVAVLRAVLLVPPRRLHVLLPLAGLLVAAGQAADIAGSSPLPLPAAAGAGVLQAIAIVGLPSVCVLAVTARREARIARTGESAAVEREREAIVQAAVAQERAGMARELHDIAAHHVSSIALMAAAIERQIDGDPDAAKRSVRQVRDQSRTLLDDLRRLVGLLRSADDVDAVETLDTIPRLVDEARAMGRTVALRVEGGREVGPLSQLVAYRMVQESLVNSARHAPGASCVVQIDGTLSDLLIVSVRNAPSTTSQTRQREGLGLLGMRERASLVGGSIAAGPDDDGGWTVRLTLPRERQVERSEDAA